jgi:hypothetical protein
VTERFDPYESLSVDEMKKVADLTKWSGTAIVAEHRALLRLVGKVRTKLERHVDKHMDDDDWMPGLDFTAAYRSTVDGGARLIESWYKREKQNSSMALTDEQLDIELNKAALALFEQIPLDEAERSIKRRRYIEERGEERQPRGERAAQNAHLLKRGDR